MKAHIPESRHRTVVFEQTMCFQHDPALSSKPTGARPLLENSTPEARQRFHSTGARNDFVCRGQSARNSMLVFPRPGMPVPPAHAGTVQDQSWLGRSHCQRSRSPTGQTELASMDTRGLDTEAVFRRAFAATGKSRLRPGHKTSSPQKSRLPRGLKISRLASELQPKRREKSPKPREFENADELPPIS